jgi:hypothetical protein
VGVEAALMEEVWSKTFEVDGREFEAVFMRRPFREGLEVRILVDDQVLSIAEFGFGETALLEKARIMVAEYLKQK